MTTESKDIYDALLAGTRQLDNAFRLIISAKYIAEDPELKLEISGILKNLISVEEGVLSLLVRLNENGI